MPYHVKTPGQLVGDVYWKGDNTWTETYADRKQFAKKSDADAVQVLESAYGRLNDRLDMSKNRNRALVEQNRNMKRMLKNTMSTSILATGLGFQVLRIKILECDALI